MLEEHVAEACFLWTHWQSALSSPVHTLADVAEGPEQRLRAHLDAIVFGGKRVADLLLKPAFEEGDEERLRVASFCLLREGEGADVDLVLRHFVEGGAPLRAILQQPLELSERPGLSRALAPLLAASDAALRANVLEILGFRRTHPAVPFQQLLTDPSVEVRAAALRIAHFWPQEVPPGLLQQALTSSDTREQVAAIPLGLILDDRAAWKACQQRLEQPGAAGDLARAALACRGDAHDVEALLALLEIPALRREALWALGFTGRVAAAQACLAWMQKAPLAAVAAEAFCAITGLVLEGPLTKPRDEADEPADEALDADLQPDPDRKLPIPEPAAVAAWWHQMQKGLHPGTRHLGGQPRTQERLVAALTDGPMRRRPILALALAITSRGRQQVEPRDFSHIQYEQLRGARR
ncbi:TIGR02270 family protein [Pyxidicoccus xibeiensis]|uniref:TIGR02270 family protein n=1 Tax=Pyxidicoccus xibeiensis TaxID=2906759 RepID=UPI0020A7F86E|nr:TIGR02270 family protein [Pyxidicoccus xibeiensis]MCP3137898.1 TIGR02270 family protein [Pyxidicoccus xibeiensis]